MIFVNYFFFLVFFSIFPSIATESGVPRPFVLDFKSFSKQEGAKAKFDYLVNEQQQRKAALQIEDNGSFQTRMQRSQAHKPADNDSGNPKAIERIKSLISKLGYNPDQIQLNIGQTISYYIPSHISYSKEAAFYTLSLQERACGWSDKKLLGLLQKELSKIKYNTQGVYVNPHITFKNTRDFTDGHVRLDAENQQLARYIEALSPIDNEALSQEEKIALLHQAYLQCANAGPWTKVVDFLDGGHRSTLIIHEEAAIKLALKDLLNEKGASSIAPLLRLSFMLFNASVYERYFVIIAGIKTGLVAGLAYGLYTMKEKLQKWYRNKQQTIDNEEEKEKEAELSANNNNVNDVVVQDNG
ncbi:hypothetical protein IPH25_01705 [bacterium]|nr:MAG: hypothetical protein IPG37_03835 [bacterium]QQR62141.1 MAG: hypothetical protein IPH25_01705 [bacterium]QQR63302.1 MAG: hypothetical protein IPH67_02405 [bacterium]